MRILLLLACLALSACIPPHALAQNASLAEIVDRLAGPDAKGRAIETDLDAAADWLLAELRAREAGEVMVQEFAGPDGAALRNLLLLHRGSTPEWIVLAAHYDHLGLGEAGTPNHGQVHFGADDNASGVAVLLQVERVLREQGPRERGVIFALFSGEEIGLLGARHFVERPVVPLSAVRAMVNLDTVGRLRDGGLTVFGVRSASGLDRVIEGIDAVFALGVKQVPRVAGASDDAVFDRAGIPALHLFTGAHATYHRPTDTPATLDLEGLATLVDFTAELVDYLGRADTELTYVPAGAAAAAPDPARATEGRRRVSFGSIPDFQREGPGVALTGVIPDSPAAQAGLREGDVIVEFGGAPLNDLTDYSEAMKRHAPGDVVVVVYERDGERHRVEVTLTERK